MLATGLACLRLPVGAWPPQDLGWASVLLRGQLPQPAAQGQHCGAPCADSEGQCGPELGLEGRAGRSYPADSSLCQHVCWGCAHL